MGRSGVYYPELDGLRFLAFLLVLFHHSAYIASIPIWVTLYNYGWMGVDLFLCLSAFLFAKLLFIEHQDKGDINIKFFYFRRALRIWPLYFFFFGAMLAYSVYINGWQTQMLIRSLGMVTFTDNFLSMWGEYNTAIAFSAHLWTISYEEQIYLVIPWALRRFYRLNSITNIYILGSIALFGMSIRAAYIAYKIGYLGIWAFPLTHFESILGGLAFGLGLFDKATAKIPGWILAVAGLVSLWLVTTLPNITEVQWKLMLTYPLVGIGMSLILAAATRGGFGFTSMLLKNETLGYLGKISYGLYIYHLVAQRLSLNFINGFVSPDHPFAFPIISVITTLIVTILISGLSYQLLEKPFLRIKNRFTIIHSRPI